MLLITFERLYPMSQAKQILENLGYEVEVNKKEYTLTVEGNLQRIENELNNYELNFTIEEHEL